MRVLAQRRGGVHRRDENVEKVERDGLDPHVRVAGVPQLKAARSAVEILIEGGEAREPLQPRVIVDLDVCVCGKGCIHA